MNPRGTLVVATLALAAAACAHDSTKDRIAAETQLTSAEIKAQRDQSALDDKHASEQAYAQQTNMSPDERRALLHRQQGERVAVAKDDREAIAASQAKVDGARAAVDHDRDVYARSAKDRLAALDGRVDALLDKSTKLGPRAHDEFDAYYRRFLGERKDAASLYEQLGAATDATFDGQKRALDRAIDELSTTVGKMNDI